MVNDQYLVSELNLVGLWTWTFLLPESYLNQILFVYTKTKYTSIDDE